MAETIATQQQRAVTDEEIELFELDATILGGSIYRFVSSAYSNTTITWNGNTYSPVPLEVSGFKADGTGVLPTPHIKLGNVNLAFSGIAIAFNDLRGCTITRHRTFKRFLDGQSEADPTAEFEPDVYRIDRKVAMNKVYIEWELAASIDNEGRLLPGRPVTQSACMFIYRHWTGSGFDLSKATCPFNGASTPAPYTPSTSFFDINGNVVPTGDLDVASKRFDTCCKKRFPTGILPFGGYPGVLVGQ